MLVEVPSTCVFLTNDGSFALGMVDVAEAVEDCVFLGDDGVIALGMVDFAAILEDCVFLTYDGSFAVGLADFPATSEVGLMDAGGMYEVVVFDDRGNRFSRGSAGFRSCCAFSALRICFLMASWPRHPLGGPGPASISSAQYWFVSKGVGWNMMSGCSVTMVARSFLVLAASRRLLL